jgi:hypothetical protein
MLDGVVDSPPIQHCFNYTPRQSKAKYPPIYFSAVIVTNVISKYNLGVSIVGWRAPQR